MEGQGKFGGLGDNRPETKGRTASDTDCKGRGKEEKIEERFQKSPERLKEMVAVVAPQLQQFVAKGPRSIMPESESEEKEPSKFPEQGSPISKGNIVPVARQGRELQRYTSKGRRLVVGCIPYKFKADRSLEVLVISSQKGQAILFPKGGWETDESQKEAVRREAMEEAGVEGDVENLLGKWRYKSKSQDMYKVGFMFPLNVTDELLQWPEMQTRRRKWVTAAEAREKCKEAWMKEALDRLVKRLEEQS
ncbi:nudix hydrolase 18, mitochondrial-like [Wolffia australiana]